MSWTFSVALIHKTDAPGKTRQSFLRALKNVLGFVPAGDQEPMAKVRFCAGRRSSWMAMTSPDLLPGDDPERECVYQEFGIDTICPAVLSAHEVEKIMGTGPEVPES